MNRQEDFEADDMTPPRGRVGRGLNGTPMRAAPAVETAELPMGARVGQALAPSWKGLDKVKLEDATAEGFETFWNALSVFMLFNFSVRIGDSHWTLNWRPMVNMNGMPMRNTNLPNGWNNTVDMVLYEVLRFGAEMFIGVLHQDGNVNPTMGIHALYNLVKVNARSKPSRMVETINKQSILSWDPSKGSEGYQSYMIEMQKLHAKLRVSDPQEAINLVTFMIVKNNAPTYIPAVESVVLQFTETQDSVDPIKLMQMIKSTLQGLEGQGKSLAQPTPSTTRLESSAYRGAGPTSGKQRTAFVAQGPKRSRKKNLFCFRCLKNDGHTVAECQTLEKDIDPDWQANVPEGLKHAISTWEHQRMRKASNSAYVSDSHELAERGHVLVDTGATDVLVHNLDMLVGVEKLSTSDQVEINIAKGGPLIATHRGTLKIKVISEGCRLRYLKVRNALYAPGLAVTLLGRDALEAEGIYIESGVNKPWTLVKPKEKLVIKLITNGGLLRVPAEYFVPQEHEVEEVTPTSKGDKDVPQELQQEVLETVKPKPKGFPGKKTLPVELAHRRLCHVGVSRLQDIEKNVDNFHVKIDEESRACPACGLSKSRLLAVPSGPHVQRVEGPRQGVSIDASGKKVMSIGGHRYFILFRDVFTKEIFVEFVKDLTAESLLDAFDHFVAKWSKGGEISPHVQIYADNAFLADEFEAVMTRRQWPIHACAAHEHWGNGIAERAIGSVVPLAQAAIVKR